MILTCPACGTQYVVKDGAIPPQGRQVRCASCKHSWHQDPEPLELGDQEEVETVVEAAMIDPRSGPEAEERAYAAATAGEEPAQEVSSDPTDHGSVEPSAPISADDEIAQPSTDDDYDRESIPGPEPEIRSEPEFLPPAEPADQGSAEDDFSPFAHRELHEPKRRSPLLTLLLGLLLIAALAAAFWFLAPAEWKQRIGIAGATETPLQLMMTHSDRQKLASGNELLAVTGRVINPTQKSQPVPPIQAQLRSSSGQLVYSWTIAPPARILAPGASATFNSAEVNVPAGGDELTITLGSSKA
jgi:predicted Zn finger-like uncharacterized protein